MKIKEREAFIIARTLIRAIDGGYSEATFTVEGKGNSVVGVRSKWNKKAYLFIKSGGKEEKETRKIPAMTLPIDIDVLTENVYNAINNSILLADKDLDTSRETFHAPIDDEKFTPKHEEDELQGEDLTQDEDFDDPEDMPVSDEEDEDATPGQNFYSTLFSITSKEDLVYRVRTLSKAIVEHPYEMITDELGSNKKNQEFLLQVLFYYLYELQLEESDYCTGNLYEFIKSNSLEALGESVKDADEKSLTKRPFSKFSKAPDDVKENSRHTLIMKLLNYEEEGFMEMFEQACEKALSGNPNAVPNDTQEANEAAPKQVKPQVQAEIVSEPESESEPQQESELEDVDVITDIEPEVEHKTNNIIEEDKTMANTQQGINLEVEGKPNAYVALKEERHSKNEVGELKNSSLLAKQISMRSDEFAQEMQSVFKTIIEDNWAAAEDLYIVAMALALQAHNGDAVELGTKIGADPRDIIMADYEYRIRKQNGLGF